MRKSKKDIALPQEPSNPNEKTKRKQEKADFLKELRKENKNSRKEIAEFLNVSPKTIEAYENASREIPDEKLIKLENLFFDTYNSNDREDVFTLEYRITQLFKEFNLNLYEFNCIKYYYIDYLSKHADIDLDEDLSRTVLSYIDKSVFSKYVTSQRKDYITTKFKEFAISYVNDECNRVNIKFSKKVKFDFYKSAFNVFCNMLPKDVVNENNIPCFNIDDLDVNNIFCTKIQTYVDIPNSLKEDCYNYFGLILNYKFECGRYHEQDIVLIRQGESFAFDYYDELLVTREGELLFMNFDYDVDNHIPLLFIKDFKEDEEKECSIEEMKNLKVIGTVVGILPRLQQDRIEKNQGIFNRRLKTLNDWLQN